MRSPGPIFDLRAALTDEVRGALFELEDIDADVKAVHRCRVRIKRARALAHIGKACAPGLSAVFNDSARAVMGTLARAREQAALAEAAREARDDANAATAKSLTRIAAQLETAATPAPSQADVRSGLTDLLALAQVWPESSARQMRKGVKRIVRRARHARARAHGEDAPTLRHRWRRREKDRLYASILLKGSWPESRKRRRKTTEKLGEALGRERDALLLIERLAADPTLTRNAAEAKRVLKALARRRAALAAKADALGAKLHAGGA